MAEQETQRWSVEDNGGFYEIVDENALSIIAQVDRYEGAWEDAQLLAAAPQLLAELVNSREWMSRMAEQLHKLGHYPGLRWLEHRERVDAAIAAAQRPDTEGGGDAD